MLAIIKLIIAAVFMILGASFAVINDTAVVVDLYFFTTELALSLVLLLALGIGLVLGAFASMFYFVRVKKENADLRRQARASEREMQSLRTLPAK